MSEVSGGGTWKDTEPCEPRDAASVSPAGGAEPMPLPPLRVFDSSDTPGEFNARLLCSCRVSRATAIAADEDTGDSKTVGADGTAPGATCDVSTVKLLAPTCVRESRSALDACGEPPCAVPTATRASLQNPTGRATFSHTPAVKASGLNRLRSW